MKIPARNLIIAALTGMIAVTTARGQFSTIAVDELGTGLYNGAPLPSGFFPDPFNSNIPHFAYVLPFIYNYAASPVADIHLFEPSSTGNLLPSDMLRFTRDPSGPNTLLFFYSDASLPGDPPDAPADVLAMPNPVFLFTSVVEIGLYGNPYSEAGPNGALWNTLGTVGWDGNPNGTQYTFVSDGVVLVPEPSSLVLLTGGFGILFGVKLLRRKALV